MEYQIRAQSRIESVRPCRPASAVLPTAMTEHALLQPLTKNSAPAGTTLPVYRGKSLSSNPLGQKRHLLRPSCSKPANICVRSRRRPTPAVTRRSNRPLPRYDARCSASPDGLAAGTWRCIPHKLVLDLTLRMQAEHANHYRRCRATRNQWNSLPGIDSHAVLEARLTRTKQPPLGPIVSRKQFLPATYRYRKSFL